MASLACAPGCIRNFFKKFKKREWKGGRAEGRKEEKEKQISMTVREAVFYK